MSDYDHTDKVLDKDNSYIRKQVLKLSVETYKTVNSIFGKVITFSLPLIILYSLYPFMFLETNLPSYEIAKIEKAIGLFFGLFFMPVVAIFVHRHILLKEENYASWYFLLGLFRGRYWKFMINTWFFLIMYWLMLFSIIIVSGKSYNLPFFVIFIWLALILYLQARLSLCFPIIATNQKGWIIKSFKLTENLGWSLPLAFFSILLPSILIQTFLLVLFQINFNNYTFDIIPIFLIGIFEVILRIYMVSLLAVFFSNVYLIVTKSKN
ncbi:hypothetical protein OAC11_04100 [Alphaproteobacteria bacterium]|nr:hypothetical protein [Alphaproteobacteria bacterium]